MRYQFYVPEDSELEDLLQKKAPFKPENYCFEIGKKIFPLSLQEFYDTFLSGEAPMNFLNYYLGNKVYKDIKLEQFTKDDDISEEYQIHMIIPITGVPFCKQSRFVRSIKVDRAER